MRDRILGFDLLRGLCVLGIGISRVLATQNSYHVPQHNLTLYGLYMFYAMSGACLFVAYSSRLSSQDDVVRYFVNRLVRIVPLFFLAIVIGLLLVTTTGRLSTSYLAEATLDGTFAFSLGNPGAYKLVSGGWAVGLLFAFYLMFPLLAALMNTRARVAIVVVALVAQIIFVQRVLRSHQLSEVWILYSQPLSLLGYFLAGCLIGWLTLRRSSNGSFAIWIFALAIVLAVFFVYQPTTPADSLTGIAGVVLTLVSCLAVYVASNIDSTSDRLRSVFRTIGECSFAFFMLTPPLLDFFGNRLAGLSDLAAVALVLAISIPLAYCANRFFEVPVEQWLLRRYSPSGVRR